MTEILPEKPPKGGHFYTAKSQRVDTFTQLTLRLITQTVNNQYVNKLLKHAYIAVKGVQFYTAKLPSAYSSTQLIEFSR